MDRKQFLSASTILSAASILPTNSVLAHNYQSNGFEKLTDAQGNFNQLVMPYNKNFLEPIWMRKLFICITHFIMEEP
jgi:Fe-Mn family superoxide dismutase